MTEREQVRFQRTGNEKLVSTACTVYCYFLSKKTSPSLSFIATGEDLASKDFVESRQAKEIGIV